MSVVVHADQVSKIFRLGDVGSSTLTEDIRAAYYKILGKDFFLQFHLSCLNN